MALTYTPNPEIGKACPEFVLKATDGKTYSQKDLVKASDKGFLVMFICNHCPYVKAIEDRLITLAHDLKKLDITTIAICSNDAENYPADSFENLKLRAEEKHYPFVYLYDETQSIAHKFDAVCTPDFFLYDNHEKLFYRGRLDDSWKEPEQVKTRELYNAAVALTKNQQAPLEQKPSMGCNIKWFKK